MFNVTTRYVKINDERKKCFMVRGDEAYASTVDVEISNSTPVSMEYAGFKTTLTVTLHRHRGSSTLTIYDGKEILAILDTTQSTTTYTLSDVVLAWGVEHELYAVYNSNKYTRRGKSRKIALTQPIPSDLKTEMEFTTAPAQINEGTSSATFEVTVTQPSTISDGTTVYFYDGSTLIGSSGTEDNVATITLDEPSKGRHNIRAEIQQSTSLNGVSIDHEMLVGYDVTITEYPTNETFIIGSDNTVKVQVLDMNSEPVSSASVSYNSTTATTNSSGIATFTVSSISGTSASASYGGSSSTAKPVRTFTPTSISLTLSRKDVRLGDSNQFTMTVNGTSGNGGTCEGLDIDFTVSFEDDSTSMTLHPLIKEDSRSVFTSPFNHQGKITTTASFGGVSATDYYYSDIYAYTTDYKALRVSYTYHCNYSALSNYYALTFASNDGAIAFEYNSKITTFEFTIADTTSTSNSYIVEKGGKYQFTPSPNQKYKFVENNGVITVYVDDVETSSFNVSGAMFWKIISYSGASRLQLKDIRFY